MFWLSTYFRLTFVLSLPVVLAPAPAAFGATAPAFGAAPAPFGAPAPAFGGSTFGSSTFGKPASGGLFGAPAPPGGLFGGGAPAPAFGGIYERQNGLDDHMTQLVCSFSQCFFYN
jgi:hypothetical protein